MNGLVMTVGAGAVFAVLALLVKEQKKEFGILLAITASIFIFTAILKYIPEITGYADTILKESGVDNESLTILLKVMGVAFLTELSIGICKDCNENALAVKVEIAGKLSILLCALPLFKKVIQMIMSI